MRVILTILFSALAASVGARHVTPDEAAKIASEFFSTSAPTRSALNITPVMAKSASKAETQPYYVFNAGKDSGFVIVSGDDRARKILGYSEKGTFDFGNLPPQLSAMLGQYAARIAALPADQPAHASWSAPTAFPAASGGVLLETANWGQGYPYNLQTPLIEGGHAPTGCGATALSILMQYHKWPEKGVGSHRYLCKEKEIGYDFSKTVFDFSKMPGNLAEASAEEKAEVSRLMAAAGVALGTKYESDQSSYSSGEEALALSYFFDFAPDCQFIFKENHSDEKWLEITWKQIDSGLPVIYSGSPIGIGAGHSWIVDGYNGEKTMLHCNFGWEGECNGYYALSDLMGHYYCDGMVINAAPNRNHVPNPGMQMMFDHSFTTPGIKLSVKEVKPGEAFDIVVEGLRLITRDYTAVRIAITDADCNVKEVLAERETGWFRNMAFESPIAGFEISAYGVESKLAGFEDTDRIQLFFRDSKEGDWLPVVSTLDAAASAPLTGHDWPTKRIALSIGEGLQGELMYNGSEKRRVRDGEVITTLQNGNNLLISLVQDEDPKRRIRFSVNGAHRAYSNFMATHRIVAGFYSDQQMQLQFMDENSDLFDVKVEYVEIAEPVSIAVPEAGSLSDLIPEEKAGLITDLKLTGRLNALDIWYIGEAFQLLENLDLSEVTIDAVHVDDYPEYIASLSPDSRDQEAKVLPEYALIDMWTLKSLKLPSDIEAIGGWSISHCPVLEDVVIPAGVENIRTTGNNMANLSVGSRLRKVISNAVEPPHVPDGVRIFRSGDAVAESGMELYVPAGSVENYRDAQGWKEFQHIYGLDQRGIEFDKDELIFDGPEGASLNAIVITPENCPEEVEWTVDDPSVVELVVSGNARSAYIAPRHNGTAVVTSSVELDGKKYYAECSVTVSGLETEVEKISLNLSGVRIQEEDILQLCATVLPEEAMDKTVTWSSSDETVATVDQNGLVTALKAGTTTITAETANGLRATCELTVDEKTGIEGAVKDDEPFDVYSLTGLRVRKNAIDLKGLEPGIYIVRQGSVARKVTVR